MAYETIRCPTCGFEMTHVSFAGKGQLKLEVTEWLALCQNPARSGVGACPDLNAALARLGFPPNT